MCTVVLRYSKAAWHHYGWPAEKFLKFIASSSSEKGLFTHLSILVILYHCARYHCARDVIRNAQTTDKPSTYFTEVSKFV